MKPAPHLQGGNLALAEFAASKIVGQIDLLLRIPVASQTELLERIRQLVNQQVETKE